MGEDFYQVDPLKNCVAFSSELWEHNTGQRLLKLPAELSGTEVYAEFTSEPDGPEIVAASLIYFDPVRQRPLQEFVYYFEMNIGKTTSEKLGEAVEEFKLKETITYSYEIAEEFIYPLTSKPIPVLRIEKWHWTVDRTMFETFEAV